MRAFFSKRFICVLCALSILVSAAAPAAFAADSTAAGQAGASLTAADARQMHTADEAVAALTDSGEYEAMTRSERCSAALSELEQLAAQGLINSQSIYVDDDAGMISFAYTCGVLGGVQYADDTEAETLEVPLGQSDMTQQAAAALTEAGLDEAETENGLLESLGSRYEFLGSAIIYYAFDDLINSTRYPYYAYMQAFWTTMGFTTQLDTEVTVSDLRHMDNYDLCILSAHGSYYTYAASFFTSELKTKPVILLLEESTVLKDILYGFDLLSHRVIKVNGRYCVTPDFFQSAYQSGQLNGTVILSETCEFLGVSGSEDSSMAEALLAGGADAVLGYVNNVYAVYSRSMLWDIVNRMIMGYDLRTALDHALGVYGADDLVWYTTRGGKRPHALASYAVIYGRETATLYADIPSSSIAALATASPKAVDSAYEPGAA